MTNYLKTNGGHTRIWLLLLKLTPALFRDTLFHISAHRMSVKIVQFLSQLFMFIQIFTCYQICWGEAVEIDSFFNSLYL